MINQMFTQLKRQKIKKEMNCPPHHSMNNSILSYFLRQLDHKHGWVGDKPKLGADSGALNLIAILAMLLLMLLC